MGFEETSRYQVNLIRESTRRIIKNISAYDIQKKELDFIDDSGLKAELVVRELEDNNDRLSAFVDLSGGGSTTIKELWENLILDRYVIKRDSGRAPINIPLIISDKGTSWAFKISKQFKKPRVVVNFSTWAEDKHGIPIAEAVRGTDFRKTGKKEHFDIRKEYDTLVRKVIGELYPHLKEDMRNLRGRRCSSSLPDQINWI